MVSGVPLGRPKASRRLCAVSDFLNWQRFPRCAHSDFACHRGPFPTWKGAAQSRLSRTGKSNSSAHRSVASAPYDAAGSFAGLPLYGVLFALPLRITPGRLSLSFVRNIAASSFAFLLECAPIGYQTETLWRNFRLRLGEVAHGFANRYCTVTHL